ncbi:MAG: hypothetical protein M1820_002519 [Bogoriella megaspora]|nr:MAG: hypothetical protein M1820_002519 [Bogoriella megaspora]
MPVTSRRDIIRRRRQVEEEGEDTGSTKDGAGASVLSEGSVLSDPDDDADAEADDSDLSETDGTEVVDGLQSPEQLTAKDGADQGAVKKAKTTALAETPAKRQTDTQAMMNGLDIPRSSIEEEAVDFEELAAEPPLSTQKPLVVGNGTIERQETLAERRRREHEEYRKKRDSDPAFIPNRGNFFMHDHRTESPGQNGFRPFGRGRGRGRVAVGGPFSPANQSPPAGEPTALKWQHDLHASLEIERPPQQPAANSSVARDPSKPPLPGRPSPTATSEKQDRSFSNHIANVQIRVSLAGMKQPITFSAVPSYRHTRLPNHRPPLRRDKPVRVSLPDQPPRYIFPSTERSFIFIPRALRPNQQGFGRGRGRGSYSGYGGYSSRRTSIYGGSVYSPSIALSRRSSLAREIPRESLVSPVGSVSARIPHVPTEAGKPVVRLPPGSQPQPHLAQYNLDGAVFSQPPNSVPLPQNPTFRENWPAQLPMHQPRPQKAISVTGIESPVAGSVHAPQQQEQQPFHQQVPVTLNGQQPPEGPNLYPHSRQMSHPSQYSGGTPLSNIPERAIHAQPFQPPAFQPVVYPQPYAPQGGYFYAPQNPGTAYGATLPPGAITVPVFVPAPYGQPMTSQAPAPAPGPAPAPAPTSNNTANSINGAAQSNMVAHEQNGMVYYYDPSQLSSQSEGYPAGYTVPGMGGMMTPSPDGFYYPQIPSGPMYYPPQ